LLPDLAADVLIADQAFDAEARVIEPLAQAGRTVVIPPKANRKDPRPYDQDLYKARHLIENFFAKLKQFRAIATRAACPPAGAAGPGGQAGGALPGRHPPCRRHHLAQLRARPSITIAFFASDVNVVRRLGGPVARASRR
jgi:transposase